MRGKGLGRVKGPPSQTTGGWTYWSNTGQITGQKGLARVKGRDDSSTTGATLRRGTTAESLALWIAASDESRVGERHTHPKHIADSEALNEASQRML